MRKTTSSGFGTAFGWGLALALIAILGTVIFGVYYFFHDDTAGKLKTLHAERDELVASLGAAISEKEIIALKYENGLITIEEQKSLIAVQDLLIEEYQEKIELYELKINDLLGEDSFAEIEQTFISQHVGSYYAESTMGGSFFSSYSTWPEFAEQKMLVSEELILDDYTFSDIVTYIQSTSGYTGQVFIVNDITFSLTPGWGKESTFTSAPPSYLDRTNYHKIYFSLEKNSNGTYDAYIKEYDLVQFTIPSNILNYRTEKVYLELFGDKYYVNMFDIYMTSLSSNKYFILKANTEDGNCTILNFYYDTSDNLYFILYKADDNSFHQCRFYFFK